MDAKASEAIKARTITPACAIEEDEGVVTVRVEMPGVPKDGLEVRIEGNGLSIAGRRTGSGLAGTYLLRERRFEDFRKVFTIDESIDRDKVEAELTDGILTLKLHVKEASKPRRITVS